MTPREKWRREAEHWLKRYNGRDNYAKYSDGGIKVLIQNKLKAISASANYLLIEYLNVKTSDDEKGTEISDNQQQQW